MTDKTEIIQVDKHVVAVCYFDEGITRPGRIWRIPLSEAEDIAGWWVKTGSHFEDFRRPSIDQRYGSVPICVLSATQVYARGCDKRDRPHRQVTDAGWRGKIEAEELPLARLFVTVLQRLGVETQSFGGSKGTLSGV